MFYACVIIFNVTGNLKNFTMKKIPAVAVTDGYSRRTTASVGAVRPCLVTHPKNFHPSHRIFEHIYETLNVDKKNKLITQFG